MLASNRFFFPANTRAIKDVLFYLFIYFQAEEVSVLLDGQ